jgi:hypothetical protein
LDCLIVSSSGAEVGVQQSFTYADAPGGVYLNHALEQVDAMAI